MAKPIINYMYPFDGRSLKKITFTYSGDLPYQNRLVIYRADSLDVVYDVTSYSRVLYCILPANICSNGFKYAAAIQCFDMNGTPSSLSDKTYFWCLEQPAFFFRNVSYGQTITTSSFYAELIYSQTQNEKLSQFQFFIYNANKVLLSESQVFYSSDKLTYNYPGLEDNHIYYIRAKGLTEYGTVLDTDYIKIEVDTTYNNAEYNNINAECNQHTGVVTYYTNFKVINPEEDDDFDYEDSYIDLLNKQLNYNSGYSISGDFLMGIKIKYYYDSGPIITASDGTRAFILSSYIYDNLEMRFKLTVPNDITPYILYSKGYIPEITTAYTIYIMRKNNVYQLFIFESKEDVERDIHFGAIEPEPEIDDPTAERLISDAWINTDNEPTIEILKDDIHKFVMDDEPVVLAQDLYDIWIGRKEDS